MIERACRIIEPYMATVKYEVIREDGREREQVRERNGFEDVQYEPRARACHEMGRLGRRLYDTIGVSHGEDE